MDQENQEVKLKLKSLHQGEMQKFDLSYTRFSRILGNYALTENRRKELCEDEWMRLFIDELQNKLCV